METIIIQGKSSSKASLLMQLAKELNFKTKKLTSAEIEETGIALSIQEGINSGLLNEDEKNDFLNTLTEE